MRCHKKETHSTPSLQLPADSAEFRDCSVGRLTAGCPPPAQATSAAAPAHALSGGCPRAPHSRCCDFQRIPVQLPGLSGHPRGSVPVRAVVRAACWQEDLPDRLRTDCTHQNRIVSRLDWWVLIKLALSSCHETLITETRPQWRGHWMLRSRVGQAACLQLVAELGLQGLWRRSEAVGALGALLSAQLRQIGQGPPRSVVVARPIAARMEIVQPCSHGPCQLRQTLLGCCYGLESLACDPLPLTCSQPEPHTRPCPSRGHHSTLHALQPPPTAACPLFSNTERLDLGNSWQTDSTASDHSRFVEMGQNATPPWLLPPEKERVCVYGCARCGGSPLLLAPSLPALSSLSVFSVLLLSVLHSSRLGGCCCAPARCFHQPRWPCDSYDVTQSRGASLDTNTMSCPHTLLSTFPGEWESERVGDEGMCAAGQAAYRACSSPSTSELG